MLLLSLKSLLPNISTACWLTSTLCCAKMFQTCARQTFTRILIDRCCYSYMRNLNLWGKKNEGFWHIFLPIWYVFLPIWHMFLAIWHIFLPIWHIFLCSAGFFPQILFQRSKIPSAPWVARTNGLQHWPPQQPNVDGPPRKLQHWSHQNSRAAEGTSNLYCMYSNIYIYMCIYIYIDRSISR